MVQQTAQIVKGFTTGKKKYIYTYETNAKLTLTQGKTDQNVKRLRKKQLLILWKWEIVHRRPTQT